MRARAAALAALALTTASCDRNQPQDGRARSTRDAPAEPVIAEPEGTTPMAERVAVLGVLNKRNGRARDLAMRPGQNARFGDAVVRLRACDRTQDWEAEQLTGAFVQIDVADARRRPKRVFSGWLYKETPSLNVVEHPVYDVWVKECRMTRPDETPPDDAASNAVQSESTDNASASNTP